MQKCAHVQKLHVFNGRLPYLNGSQFGNLGIFVPFRFYVKSKFILDPLWMPFRQFQKLWSTFSLTDMHNFAKDKNQSLKNCHKLPFLASTFVRKWFHVKYDLWENFHTVWSTVRKFMTFSAIIFQTKISMLRAIRLALTCQLFNPWPSQVPIKCLLQWMVIWLQEYLWKTAPCVPILNVFRFWFELVAKWSKKKALTL